MSEPRNPWARRARHGATAALPVLIPLAYLGPPLGRGDLVYGFDTLGELVPWWGWAWREIQRGVFPHWNPYVMCGLPFHGLAVVSLLYPLSALNLVLSTDRVVAAWVLVHLSLAGAFTYRFARSLGASRAASALAGTVFSGSEALFSRIAAGELPQLAVVAWFPALLWMIEEGIAARSAARLALAAIPVTWMLLAGHLQYVAYAALLAAGYGVARLSGESALRRDPRLWLAMGGTFALAVALAAPQVLPTLDAIRASHRAMGLAPTADGGISLTPLGLHRLLVPDLFGNEYEGGFVGPSVATQTPLYVGLLPLYLAALAFVAGVPRARALGTLALLTVLYAMGGRTPIAPLVDGLLPPLTGFRIASRALVLGAAPLATLAGLGLDRLLERRPISNSRRAANRAFAGMSFTLILFVVGIGTAVAIGAQSAHQTWLDLAQSSWEARAAVLPEVRATRLFDAAWTRARHAATEFLWLATASAAAAGFLSWRRVPRHLAVLAALAVVGADLSRAARPWVRPIHREAADHESIVRSRNMLPSVPRTSRVLAALPNDFVEGIPPDFLTSYGIDQAVGEQVPNLLAASGIRNVTGEIGLIPARTVLYTGNTGRYNLTRVEPASRLDALGVSLVLTPLESPPPRPDFEPAPPRESFLPIWREWRNGRALPSAVLARRVEFVPDRATAMARLDRAPDRTIDPRELALVEAIEDVPHSPGKSADESPGEVRVEHADTDWMVLSVDAQRPAWLLLFDPYDPAWRATVDGAPVEIRPAQVMFRSIPVPAGRHHVRFWYEPRSFQIGVWIMAGIGFPILIALTLAARRASRRSSDAPSRLASPAPATS